VGAQCPRRTDAERLGGAARVAGVGERPRVRAREQACELMNDPTLAPPGGKTPRRAVPRLVVAERRRARLGRGNRKVNGGSFPPDECVRVRGCTTS
jgi:hypothetical protein